MEVRINPTSKTYILKVNMYPRPIYMLMEDDGTEKGRFVRNLTSEEVKER